MSTAANLPPRSKRLSLRLAEFGLPIPPRIQQFLDGPEAEALEGARVWGLAGFSGDTKLKVRWASSRIYSIHDYALDVGFDPAAKDKYLPIAALGSESRMLAVDISQPALPVVYFDYEDGWKPWADSFEAALGKLLKKGEKTPSEKLEKVHEQAQELYEAKQYEAVLELLLPMVARFPTEVGEDHDDRDTLGACYNYIGIAHEKAKRIAEATIAYERAYAMGTESAGLNICDLYLDEHKDYAGLVRFGEKMLPNIWAFSDKYAWFHVRNYLGQGYLLTGNPTKAIRTYHQIFDMFHTADPAKLGEAIDDLRKLRERPEADLATISSILSWLDAPPVPVAPERLAALRAWWPTVPSVARVAMLKAISFEGAPGSVGDDELARIAQITDLEVEDAALKDLGWVTMLDKLDDLDLEGSSITDLSPVATLRRLTRLDCSENKITTLAPLANLRWLERLSAGENPLETDLAGLESLHELSYLHVTEAGLESIEPLRGLRELEEVTLYENKIADISPLADSPRLKEISSFSNPINRGFAALGRLRWLESIDAGDESDPKDLKALHLANPRVSIDHFYPDDDADSVDVVLPPDPTLRAWWEALPKAWQDAFGSELDGDSKKPTDEALLKLVHEDHISIDGKPLPDLEPLRKFSRMDYLCIGNTGIVDLSPLSRLASLRELIARENKIDLATLAPAELLEELYIERCQLTSLAGIASCKLLRELHGEDNQVEDLTPLSNMKDLRVLDLENNRVSDLTPLANLPRLRTLKLGLNRVADVAPLARCIQLRVVELWANQPLANGLALADLPDLVKVVTHGGLSRADLAELRRRRPDVSWD